MCQPSDVVSDTTKGDTRSAWEAADEFPDLPRLLRGQLVRAARIDRSSGHLSPKITARQSPSRLSPDEAATAARVLDGARAVHPVVSRCTDRRRVPIVVVVLVVIVVIVVATGPPSDKLDSLS